MIDKKRYQNMSSNKLNEVLLYACESGDLETVKYLLSSPDFKKHANIHYKGNYGGNSLLLASKNGYLEVVKYLLSSPDLKKHADIHYEDNFGYNALLYACRKGHLEVVKYLLSSEELKEHANINYENTWNNVTALIFACQEGYLEIVKYLLTSSDLKEHADINYTDKFGWNALMEACYSQNTHIVEFLLIDMNMTIDNKTMKRLQDENHHDIIKIIEYRDLYEKLDNSVSDDKINNKKVKL